jgi:hypothetical protein
MQNGFSTLFGARFQEICLKISYSLANAVTPDVRLPDVVGTITRAQAGFDAAKAMREISAVGQFVSNNARAAHFHENGILKHAQRVTELDIAFLEQIRDEVAQGIDAFYLVASMGEPTGTNQIKLASYLLSILERISARVEVYYGSLSQESIYRPEIKNNPARTRWHNIRQKITDESFFISSKPLTMSHNNDFSSGLPTRSALYVSFAQILASAQHTIQSNSQSSQSQSLAELQQPRRLADMHTAHAAQNSHAPSTFESEQQNIALKRMSNFISANMFNIRRLNRLPANYDFSEVIVACGKQPGNTLSTMSPMVPQNPARTPTNLSTAVLQNQQGITATPSLPAPRPIRANTAPSLERNVPQLNYRQLPQDQATPFSPPSESASSILRSPSIAAMHMNRRQPPRSSTPLPASPRASLALSHSASRRKVTTDVPPPMPVLQTAGAGMNALKLVGR